MNDTTAKLSGWDLGELYESLDDPRIATDREDARRRAQAFADVWRGRVASLDGPTLKGALEDLESIMALVRRPGHYASLRYSVATEDPACRAAQSAAQSFDAEIDQLLAFWNVELKELTEGRLAAMPGREALQSYEHWLKTQRVFAPYTLSEDAEKTGARKDVTGKQAWVNLYTQVTASLQFKMRVDGEDRWLTRGEVQAFASSKDRGLREQATQTIVDGFAPHREVLGFVFNTLFEDHRLEMKERGYQDVMQYTVLQDDLEPEVVDALLSTSTRRMEIVQRYHALRRRVMELPDYGTQDLRAPAFGEEPDMSWGQAREAVVAAFSAFAPRAGELAGEFLDGGRVDVFPKKGKTSGAFCSPGFPPVRPYVMLNFAGKLDDAFTLAHEFGHALHFTLALEQSPLNYWAGKALAETASVFAELWLHEHLVAQTKDAGLRRLLLDRQVQDAAATAFHQVAYIHWERRAHAARAEGVVPLERFGEIWDEEMARLLGPAVQRKERDRWRWITIPHFVFARFYCYSYAFGKLLTLSLHGLWKERGGEFVNQYMDLLRAGGSRAPRELLAGMGVDLADPGFWEKGCGVVESYLDELETMR
jgi:oligoendopeptidase F